MHPKDKKEEKQQSFQKYDTFELQFGFKGDKLEIKRDRSKRDRYGAKAKKLKQQNEKGNI